MRHLSLVFMFIFFLCFIPVIRITVLMHSGKKIKEKDIRIMLILSIISSIFIFTTLIINLPIFTEKQGFREILNLVFIVLFMLCLVPHFRFIIFRIMGKEEKLQKIDGQIITVFTFVSIIFAIIAGIILLFI